MVALITLGTCLCPTSPSLLLFSSCRLWCPFVSSQGFPLFDVSYHSHQQLLITTLNVQSTETGWCNVSCELSLLLFASNEAGIDIYTLVFLKLRRLKNLRNGFIFPLKNTFSRTPINAKDSYLKSKPLIQELPLKRAFNPQSAQHATLMLTAW